MVGEVYYFTKFNGVFTVFIVTLWKKTFIFISYHILVSAPELTHCGLMYAEITLLELLPHFPGVNGLTEYPS